MDFSNFVFCFTFLLEKKTKTKQKVQLSWEDYSDGQPKRFRTQRWLVWSTRVAASSSHQKMSPILGGYIEMNPYAPPLVQGAIKNTTVHPVCAGVHNKSTPQIIAFEHNLLPK